MAPRAVDNGRLVREVVGTAGGHVRSAGVHSEASEDEVKVGDRGTTRRRREVDIDRCIDRKDGPSRQRKEGFDECDSELRVGQRRESFGGVRRGLEGRE